MDGALLVSWLFRFLHIWLAIVLVGGTVFMRFALIPAANSALSDDVHAKLREKLMGNWKKFVHSGIAIVLVSGFYNYFNVIYAKSQDGLYHGLVGTKMILAFVIFFIASALVGKSAAFAKMRENARFWLTVNVALAIVIVGISTFVRVRGPRPKADAAKPVAMAVQAQSPSIQAVVTVR